MEVVLSKDGKHLVSYFLLVDSGMEKVTDWGSRPCKASPKLLEFVADFAIGHRNRANDVELAYVGTGLEGKIASFVCE